MKEKCSCDCECNKEIKLYFCPKCRSKNVAGVFSLRNAFGMFPRWKCKSCGFEAMTFPIMVFDPGKFKENKNKLNKKKI